MAKELGKSLDGLLARINLGLYIGRYVPLKRSGRGWLGKCPFHSDSTPSFSVNEMFYKCFGCGAKGNAITFEKAQFHLEFREAVDSLAGKFQYTIDWGEITKGGPQTDPKVERRKFLLGELHNEMRAWAGARCALGNRLFPSPPEAKWHEWFASKGWDRAEWEGFGLLPPLSFESSSVLFLEDHKGQVVCLQHWEGQPEDWSTGDAGTALRQRFFESARRAPRPQGEGIPSLALFGISRQRHLQTRSDRTLVTTSMATWHLLSAAGHGDVVFTDERHLPLRSAQSFGRRYTDVWVHMEGNTWGFKGLSKAFEQITREKNHSIWGLIGTPITPESWGNGQVARTPFLVALCQEWGRRRAGAKESLVKRLRAECLPQLSGPQKDAAELILGQFLPSHALKARRRTTELPTPSTPSWSHPSQTEESQGATPPSAPLSDEDFFSAMGCAQTLFVQQLEHTPHAQEYLMGRGWTPERARDWGFGWASDSTIQSSPEFQTPSRREAAKAIPLVKEREGRGEWFDFFRQRLTLPIKDWKGRVVALAGRTLENRKDIPKYINSSESRWFHKAETLFNLDKALPAILKERAVYVVEGYMDAMALSDSGIDNVVAVMGTALTEKHVQLLHELCGFLHIHLCFDSDAAGEKALLHSFRRVFPLGLATLSCFQVPDGKDPDEFLKAHNTAEFRKLAQKGSTLLRHTILWCHSHAQGQTERYLDLLGEHVLPVLAPMPPGPLRSEAQACLENLLPEGVSLSQITARQWSLPAPLTPLPNLTPPPTEPLPLWIPKSPLELEWLLGLACTLPQDWPAPTREMLWPGTQEPPSIPHAVWWEALAGQLSWQGHRLYVEILSHCGEGLDFARVPADALSPLAARLQALTTSDGVRLARLGLSPKWVAGVPAERPQHQPPRPGKSSTPLDALDWQLADAQRNSEFHVLGEVFAVQSCDAVRSLLLSMKWSLRNLGPKAVLEQALSNLCLQHLTQTIKELSELLPQQPQLMPRLQAAHAHYRVLALRQPRR